MSIGKRISRAKEVEYALLEKLDELGDEKGQLPSEADITQLFHVSRVTVREALSALERRGLIIRKHGVGTFVNQIVRAIPVRLDESVEFGNLIRISGYVPGVRLVDWFCRPASPDVASRLAIPPGTEVLTTCKIFSADDVPVIYCINQVPLNLAPARPSGSYFHETILREPVYELLEKEFGQVVAYQVADIESRVAEGEVADHLNYPRGSSIMVIDEVGYNVEQRPLFLGQEYYRPGLIRFQLLRKPG